MTILRCKVCDGEIHPDVSAVNGIHEGLDYCVVILKHNLTVANARNRWHGPDESPPKDGVYILMIKGSDGKPYVGQGLYDAYNGGFFRFSMPVDVIGWAYWPAGEEAILYGERGYEEEEGE